MTPIASECLLNIGPTFPATETSLSLTPEALSGLTSYAGDFPARIFPLPQTRQPESSAIDLASGKILQGFLWRYGLNTRWLKTHPPFVVVGLPWSYKICTRSGMMRNGIVFPLAPLVRLTRGTESLLLPTLQDMEQARFSGTDPRRPKYATFRPSDAQPRGAYDPEKSKAQNHSVSLHDQIYYERLATLRSSDGERGGRGDLIQQLRGNNPSHHRLPTLTAGDGKNGPERRGGKHRRGGNLAGAMLPTLIASDWKSRSPAKQKTNSRPLREVLPALTANRWSGLQSHGENAMLGPLNPAWCEWFMGFPIGWTELED